MIRGALHEVCLGIQMAFNPGMFTVGLLHEVCLALKIVFRFSNVYGRLSRKTKEENLLKFLLRQFSPTFENLICNKLLEYFAGLIDM